jgi:hypothetical protein
MEPLESTPQRTFGYAGSHPVDPKGLTRFQRVADLLFWGGAQNPLQRDCPVQTGSGCLAAFSDPSALGFFPMPTLEKVGGLQARPVDAARQRALTVIRSG